MSPFRAAKSYVSRVRAAMGGVGENADELSALRVAHVALAIHERECSEKKTTLRQLHKITELTQSEALNAIEELERLGWVSIERDIMDAFESLVTLTDKAMRQLSRTDFSQQSGKAA